MWNCVFAFSSFQIEDGVMQVHCPSIKLSNFQEPGKKKEQSELKQWRLAPKSYITHNATYTLFSKDRISENWPLCTNLVQCPFKRLVSLFYFSTRCPPYTHRSSTCMYCISWRTTCRDRHEDTPQWIHTYLRLDVTRQLPNSLTF